MIHGVDLSHHNGEHAAPLDVAFYIVRISYGTQLGHVVPDLAAEGHFARALSSKGPRILAAYHYLATSPESAPGED